MSEAHKHSTRFPCERGCARKRRCSLLEHMPSPHLPPNPNCTALLHPNECCDPLPCTREKQGARDATGEGGRSVTNCSCGVSTSMSTGASSSSSKHSSCSCGATLEFIVSLIPPPLPFRDPFLLSLLSPPLERWRSPLSWGGRMELGSRDLGEPPPSDTAVCGRICDEYVLPRTTRLENVTSHVSTDIALRTQRTIRGCYLSHMMLIASRSSAVGSRYFRFDTGRGCDEKE